MPRKIEATVTPELYNRIRDEAKRRRLRLHQAAGELLAERLTLQAEPVVLETTSMSEAPRPRRRSRSNSGSNAPKGETHDTGPAPGTSGT